MLLYWLIGYGILILAGCIFFSRRQAKSLTTAVVNATLSACCFGALMITMKQFINMGIYVDEHGTSPDAVLGGEFDLALAWLKLVLLALAFALSLINCVKRGGNQHE